MSLLKTTLGLSLGLALALPLIADDAKPAATASTKTAATSAAPKAGKADPAVEAAMKKSDCFTCHSAAKKIVGPAYKDVAKKYKGDAGAVDKLTAKVKKGGSGVWGAVPMSAHPNLKDDQIKAMVQWVLAQK
jgi:cytochrome c